jgi:hypothetical protein
LQKPKFLSVAMVAVSFHSTAVADEAIDLCDNAFSQFETPLVEVNEGPFLRPNGDEVGEIDLGIVRSGWTKKTIDEASCRVGDIEIDYRVRDSLTDQNNYVFFKLLTARFTEQLW